MLRLLKPIYDKYKNIRIISRTCLHVYIFRKKFLCLFSCRNYQFTITEVKFLTISAISGTVQKEVDCSVSPSMLHNKSWLNKKWIFSLQWNTSDCTDLSALLTWFGFFGLFYEFGKDLSTSGTNTSFLFFYYFRSSTSSCTSLHRSTSHVRINKFLMNFELHHSFMADKSTDLFQHNVGFKWMCDLT